MAKLESLDLNRLLTLHWLLEDAHVSRAALHLGTTQPAVSRSLRNLRVWFGDPLLVRSGRTLVRTPFAELIRPRLAHAIAELRDLAEPSVHFDPVSARGVVRIVCTDYMAALVLSAWDKQIASHAPHLDLELLAPSRTRTDELESGSVDLMVLPSRTPAGEGELARVPWFKDRYATLIRVDHPLAGKRIGWKRFAELEHVQVVTGVGGTSEIDRAFRQHGLERRIALRVGSFVLAVQALASRNRVATLPARVVAASPVSLAQLQTPLDLLPFTLDLIFHPRMSQHPRHVFLRQALLSLQ